MTDPQTPATEAGRRLLEREAYNARSFAIVRPQDILAIEAEARARSWDKGYTKGAVDGLVQGRADALREAADAVRDAAVERGDDTVHITTLLAILDPQP